MPLRRRARTGSSASPRTPTPTRCRVEVRYGGVDVLADPGTYCYHGEPAWRSYFRSTIAHNTVELGGRNQSGEGGPFLWLRHANGRGDRRRGHRRNRGVDRRARRLPVAAPAGPAPPLGPAGPGRAQHRHRRRDRRRRPRRPAGLPPRPRRRRRSSTAATRCCAGPRAATPGEARLELPPGLRWSLHRGETDPDPRLVLARPGPARAGLYPAGLRAGTPGVAFTTQLDFIDTGKTEKHIDTGSAVSRRVATSHVNDVRKIRAEAG